MYGKLFSQMYDGTLAGNWKALVTFQQMIVLCDSAGVIDMTAEALSRRTGIPLDVIQEGIAALEAPDPSSRTPDNEGRRIERLDAHRAWGWVLVNHKKYQQMVSHEEKRAADRERIATKRAAQQMSQVVAECRVASRHVADVAHTDTDADTDTDTKKSRARGSRFALTQLPDEWALFAAEERPDLDPAGLFAKFGDYWRGVPGSRGRKSDWDATWRNFVRTERRQPEWAKPKQSPEQVAAEALKMMEARDAQARTA